MLHQIQFRLSENPWAPTAVIEQVNAGTGAGLTLTGLADQVGGVSSAAFVAWPDGRQSALIRPPMPMAAMRLAGSVINEVRARGLPVPEYQLLFDLGDGYVAVVQERLTGRHVDLLDPTTTASFLATNERFAGLLRGRPDVPPPPAFPSHDGGYGVFEETIGGHSRRGRRLLDRLLTIDGGRPFRMDGDDLVHLDYSPGNVLFDDAGQVSGVVDWNFGVARGDRLYSLVGLGWGSVGQRAIPPAELTQIEGALDALDPATRSSYEAHALVHAVHASIDKGFPPERVDAEITRAEQYLL